MCVCSGTNKGLAIGLGVALGLLCLIIIPAIFLIIRRRRQKQVLARYQTLDSHLIKSKFDCYLPYIFADCNDCIF